MPLYLDASLDARLDPVETSGGWVNSRLPAVHVNDYVPDNAVDDAGPGLEAAAEEAADRGVPLIANGRALNIDTAVVMPTSGLKKVEAHGAAFSSNNGGDVNNQFHMFQFVDVPEGVDWRGGRFVQTGTWALYTNAIRITTADGAAELASQGWVFDGLTFEKVRVGLNFYNPLSDETRRVGGAFVDNIRGLNVVSAVVNFSGAKECQYGKVCGRNEAGFQTGSYDVMSILGSEDIQGGLVEADGNKEFACLVRNLPGCSVRRVKPGNITAQGGANVSVANIAGGTSADRVEDVSFGEVDISGGGALSISGVDGPAILEDITVHEAKVDGSLNAGASISVELAVRPKILTATVKNPVNQALHLKNTDNAFVGHVDLSRSVAFGGTTDRAFDLDRARKTRLGGGSIKSFATGIYLIGASGTMGRVLGGGFDFDTVTDPIAGDGTTSSSHKVQLTGNQYNGQVPTYVPADGSFISGQILEGVGTFNPISLTNGLSDTTTVSVPGAALGDQVAVLAPYSLNNGFTATAWVNSTDVVRIMVVNETGGTVDLASGSWKVRVLK